MTRRMALGSMLLTLVTGAGMVAFGGARAQARAERALRQALMAAAQGVQIPSSPLPRWRLWRVRFADGNVLEADVLPLRGRAVIVDLGTPHR